VTTPFPPPGYSSVLRSLYRTKVRVLRIHREMVNGAPVLTWEQVPDILDPYLDEPGMMMCRLDLQFTRPGKDAPQPIVAGRAPDRVGVVFYDYTQFLLAGDRLECVEGPIAGTFELRQVPEAAQDYGGAHHGENQVIEVAQTVVSPVFPGEEPT
jgi:hypothetical protein